MRIAYLVLLVAASQAVKFLEEPAVFTQLDDQPFMQHTIFAQQSSLFTDDQLALNSEFGKPQTGDFNYLDEQITALDSADQSQVFLAAQYEKDLPATGDCVILYAQCEFQGTSGKVCKSEDALNFQLPVFSIYVPLGQQFATVDSESREQVAFLTSEKCLAAPIVLADTQKDVFISKMSQSLVGDLADEEMVGPQPQLLTDTQLNFDQSEEQAVDQQTQAVETQVVDQAAIQAVDDIAKEPLAGQSQ